MQISPVELSQFNIISTNNQRCPSREKLYQELGLEYLHHRCWRRRVSLLYKILSNKIPEYIYEFISPIRQSFRNSNSFTIFLAGLSTLRIPFFRVSRTTGINSTPKMSNSTSYLNFINALINFIRTSENKIFNVHDEVGIKLLTRLRLGFNNSQEQKLIYIILGTLYVLQYQALNSNPFFSAGISTM